MLLLTVLWSALWGADPSPAESVLLQGEFPGKSAYNLYTMGSDGTFLVNAGYFVYHLDHEGRLIRKIGGKGSGPGLLPNGVENSFWDGRFYLVGGYTLVNRYDSQGRFLDAHGYRFKSWEVDGGHAFGSFFNNVDYENLDQSKLEVGVAFDPETMRVERAFHRAPDSLKSFGTRFLNCYFAVSKDRVFVVGEIDPVLFVYDSEHRLLAEHALHLPWWEEHPEGVFNQWRNAAEYNDWWFSFSKFRGLDFYEDRLVLAYEVPSEDELFETVVVFLNERGTPVSKPLKRKGHFLGCYEGRLHFLRVVDADDRLFPELWVDRVVLP